LPFINVTVPVGAGTPEAPVTVAVKVTLEPTAIEDAEAVSAVVVAPRVTVTVTEVDADATFLLSPG
jgi:hypothetical protein